MYSRILIISDNIYLSKRFKEIINDHKNGLNICVDFSVSPFSSYQKFTKELNHEVKVFDLRKKENINRIVKSYDLIFSLHCKQIFPAQLINSIKCINIHPGYNPINRGWYPQVFSINNDLPIGVTIHEMDEELDNGPIIKRELIEKKSYDTSFTLYQRILETEIKILQLEFLNIIEGNYSTFLPEGKGNLFLKKDFNQLCQLDLEERTTVGDLLKKLRALSHDNFKNAFYYDVDTQKKIYITLTVKSE